jgi:hypothetical protein
VLDFSVGVALNLKAPIIEEGSIGNSLDPFNSENTLTAVVEYTGMALQDKIIAKFTGAVGTPAGGSYTAPEKIVLTLGPQKIALDTKVVAFNLNKAATVNYTMLRGSKAPLPSEDLLLNVLPMAHEDARNPMSTIDGMPGPVLDVNALTGAERTRTGKWVLIALNQKIWMRYSGINADNTAYESKPYDGASVPQAGLDGMHPLTPRADLRLLKHGSDLHIEVKIGFDDSTEESKAIRLPKRTYKINAVEDVKPVITRIADSKDVEILPGGITVDTAVKLTGTASKSQKVEIFVGAASKGEADVHASTGVWTKDVTGLGLALHTVTAKAKYGSAQTSDPRTLTVVALIVPRLVHVLDINNMEVPDNTLTGSTTLKLQGNASIGKQIEVFDGNGASAVSKGKASAHATTGDWELTFNSPPGTYRLFARALYPSNPLDSNVRNLTVESGFEDWTSEPLHWLAVGDPPVVVKSGLKLTGLVSQPGGGPSGSINYNSAPLFISTTIELGLTRNVNNIELLIKAIRAIVIVKIIRTDNVVEQTTIPDTGAYVTHHLTSTAAFNRVQIAVTPRNVPGGYGTYVDSVKWY